MSSRELVIRFGRPFDISTPGGAFLAGVLEVTVPFADRESAEAAQREVSVCVRPVHDAGGEDYRPVVAGEVVREPAGIEAGDMARAYLNPAGGFSHRHGAREAGWVAHDHLGGGLPHTHDPETGFQVPLTRDVS